ncbi:MAG: GAF domain-containing protein [Chloroflexi bacterium]|nr:GAF domain-containing protein [Chloroflexota bacterium]
MKRHSATQRISRMALLAEELRAQLDNFNRSLQTAGQVIPADVLTGLEQISGKLDELKENVRKNEHERHNLQALAEIGQIVNSSLDLTTVLSEVIDTIIRLTGAERAFLMLHNDAGELQYKIARNWEQESLNKDDYEVSRTLINRVLEGGEAILTTNASEDPRFGAQESVVAYNLRSVLCVPLKVKGKLTGVIYADNKVREGLFTESDRALLSGFANQAAVALENARLFGAVQATLDEVTELKNLMEDVFASIASGVITSDVEDIITLCNKAAQTILSMTSEELIGSSLNDLLPKLSEELADQVAAAKRTDDQVTELEISPTLDGRGPVALSLKMTPLKSADEKSQGVTIVLDDLTEKRRLEAQRKLFERMVSPAVINQIDPNKVKLGGSLATITTLFADVRGFTAFSEEMDPESLVALLNLYFGAAVDSVLAEEGTIDKFQGDAIMAWFNHPVPQEDHTLRAARAALRFRDAVGEVRKNLEPKLHLSFGVGIHVGEALLGLIGTPQRLDYTAIGDSVNTAKRIQENAEPDQILVSAEAKVLLGKSVTLEAAEAIEAKGKKEPVEVFELVGLA